VLDAYHSFKCFEAMNIDCTIVIPIYNEEEGLRHFFDTLVKECEKLQYSFELIFVDDGSSDKSLEIIKSLKGQGRISVTYTSFSKNYGHQTALRAGYHRANGNYVVTMDGDNQHPPSEIKNMIAHAKEGFHVVVGLRDGSERGPFLKKITSALYYRAWSWLTDVKIHTGSSDFRLISRDVLHVVNRHEEEGLFLRGLIANMGYRIKIMSYAAAPRYSGQTKFNFSKMSRLALDGIISGSVKPLRLAVSLSFVSSVLAVLFGMYSVYAYLNLEETAQGWTSIVSIVCLIGTFQLFAIGVLGEYLTIILKQTRDRPLYIVKEEKSIGGPEDQN
jgi:glycosyltransferase involved in cell wall biosynthesis